MNIAIRDILPLEYKFTYQECINELSLNDDGYDFCIIMKPFKVLGITLFYQFDYIYGGGG